ncbi:hypothetical protein KGD82_00235 [Nocardiopsis eucommiae]|uniref:DUF4352 domain-containing protein n=1 Tax=Nocardiopsis eucommiae TaxID=2831970 RepID=A0A975QKN9_9ACTN|nr:hypothetical protein KGD82_00235 [Nocardiopsis eucommiae]
MNRALSILTCACLVVLIAVLQRFVVGKEDMVDPITTAGDTDAAVTTDDFTVRVTEVDLATSLEAPGDADGGTHTVEANGAWVLVWADVTATRETIENLPSELRMRDGSVYVERGWFRDSLDHQTFSPGLPVHGAFVFEVPTDRIEKPALVVTHAFGYDSRLGAQAKVDLGLENPEPTDRPATLLPAELRADGAETGEDDHAST